MNKSKALPLVTIISMIIVALVLSASDDAINNFSINNGGLILSLHMTALARVFAIKTQLSNRLKEIQIAPRFVKRNNRDPDRRRPSDSIIKPYCTIILPNTIKNLVITILGEPLGDPAKLGSNINNKRIFYYLAMNTYLIHIINVSS